jgi:RNA-binding protein YlmH
MTALCCTLRAEDGVTHRDLLGSLMGLSITRGKIGDILVTPELAQVIVSADIAEYLLTNWTSAGRARLRVEPMALSELEIPEQKVKEIRDTVATLRLDAVTASGFSISRARAAELIASGRVQKNYRETTKPDAPVAQGDVISARGVGKFELSEVGGLSRKGRTAILLRRYL